MTQPPPPPMITHQFWRWVAPVPASCLLLAVFGLLFASGVYISLINDQSLVKAFGVVFLSNDFGILAAGYFLHRFTSVKSYVRAPQKLAVLASLLIGAQALMVPALVIHSPALLNLAAVLYGFGSGAAYIIAVSVLQAWVPEFVGSITALGLLFTQIGSLLGTYMFRAMSSLLGSVLSALLLTSLTSGVIVSFTAPFLARPTPGWHPNALQYLPFHSAYEDETETTNLLEKTVKSGAKSTQKDQVETHATFHTQSANECKQPQLTVIEVLQSWMFYPYIMAVVAEQVPGASLMFVFPQMLNVLFGTPLDTATKSFACVHIGGMVGRVISGLAIDIVSNVIRDASDFMSTKMVNSAILLLQTLSFVIMMWASTTGNALYFTIAGFLVGLCFCGGAVAGACQARGMYTPHNTTLVFASSGLVTGLLTVVYSYMLSEASGEFESLDERRGVEVFQRFFLWSIALSFVGFLCCLSTKRSKRAYQKAYGNQETRGTSLQDVL